MNRQAQIDRFLLEAHRLAVARLRDRPERIEEASAVLRRWRDRAGATRSDAYWGEWEQLLGQGVDAVERATCGTSDHAAVLRSVSPLIPLVSQKERAELLRGAREPA